MTAKLFTIGFTKWSAEGFFETIKQEHVQRVIDVRLNNKSQLAGFAKSNDLKYFLNQICEVEYVHVVDLAPTEDMLSAYRNKKIPWGVYEKEFLALITQREIEKRLPRDLLEGGCLLCSEKEPHFCHRRLVVEYLKNKWDIPLQVKHL